MLAASLETMGCTTSAWRDMSSLPPTLSAALQLHRSDRSHGNRSVAERVGRTTVPLKRGRALHMFGTPQGRSRLALTIVTSLTRKIALVRGPSAASGLFGPGQVRSRPASVASRRARLTLGGGTLHVGRYRGVSLRRHQNRDLSAYRRDVSCDILRTARSRLCPPGGGTGCGHRS